MVAQNGQVLAQEYLSQDRYPEVFAACTIAFVVCILCVFLRLIAVRLARQPLWFDDYAAISAAVFAIANYVFMVLWKDSGFGKHIEAAVLVDPSAPRKYLQRTLIQEILYIMAITSARLSILAFMWRIFGLLRVRWILVGLMGLSGAWAVGVSLGSLLSCIPVKAYWDLTITDKRCIDHYKFYVGVGISNMLIDFSIAIVPIPYVVRMKISTAQKAMVACTFLVGGLTCVITAAKLGIIFRNVSFADPTWGSVDVMKWSGVEMFCSIISVCLPTYRPLMRWVHARFKSILDRRIGDANDSDVHSKSEKRTVSVDSEESSTSV